MEIIDFKGSNSEYAKDQPQYITLPAYKKEDDDPGESVAFCIKLTEAEIKQVNERGEVWMKIFTFGRPFPPILTSVLIQDCIPNEIASELLKHPNSSK